MGVVQSGDGASLPLEALQPVRIGGHLLRQDLDRDVTPEARVPRAVHRSHAAGPEKLDDLVWPEASAGRERHDRASRVPKGEDEQHYRPNARRGSPLPADLAGALAGEDEKAKATTPACSLAGAWPRNGARARGSSLVAASRTANWIK
jgi:hypothetical protein